MYTTSTIPFDVQHNIINNATAAVKSIVISRYPTLFTKEEIEDIVGNTNYKACRSIGGYDPRWALSTWVGKIARNCVITAVDYKMKRLPISAAMVLEDEQGDEVSCLEFGSYRGDEYEADREITLDEFNDAVEDAASTLSEKDKPFFEMMKDKKTPKEMAAVAGCSANAAAIRGFRIREALRGPLAAVAKEFGFFCKKLAS